VLPVARDAELPLHPNMIKPLYLTASHITELLHISERTLYTYVNDGRLPRPIRLGGKRLWPAQALHDHLGAERLKKGPRRKPKKLRQAPNPAPQIAPHGATQAKPGKAAL
jgi:predicted DNA-binding transcriptional regulator AlpA